MKKKIEEQEMEKIALASTKILWAYTLITTCAGLLGISLQKYMNYTESTTYTLYGLVTISFIMTILATKMEKQINKKILHDKKSQETTQKEALENGNTRLDKEDG